MRWLPKRSRMTPNFRKKLKNLRLRGIDPRLYQVWIDMRQHCNNPNSQVYRHYGGRGIRVCKRWDKFENFAADVGPHPGKGWSIHRKNNDSDYKPSNVEWATRSTQQRNKRTTKLSWADVVAIRARYKYRENQYTEGVSFQQLADEFGIGHTTVENIVKGRKWQP
jgi:hypothetical protein